MSTDVGLAGRYREYVGQQVRGQVHVQYERRSVYTAVRQLVRVLLTTVTHTHTHTHTHTDTQRLVSVVLHHA